MGAPSRPVVALAVAAVVTMAARVSGGAPSSLWNVSAGPTGTKSDPSLSADGRTVFIGLNSGAVAALSAATGTTIWRRQTGGQVFAGVVPSPGSGDRVYVGSGDGSEYCLDAATGAIIWQFATDGAVYASRTPAPRFSCRAPLASPARDTPLDIDRCPFAILSYSTPTLSRTDRGAALFTGSLDGHVYALDADTGRLRWKSAALPGPVASASVLSPDDATLFVGCHGGAGQQAGAGGTILAMRTLDGAVIWSRHTAAQVQSDQVISADGATLFIGSDDGNAYAINTSTGGVVWQLPTGGAVQSGLTLSTGDGGRTLFFGSFGGDIWAVVAATGRLVWKTAAGGPVGSKPVLHTAPDGTEMLYQGSFDGSVYALAAGTGAVMWRWPTGGAVHSDPVISDAQVLICASYSGAIFALNISAATAAVTVTATATAAARAPTPPAVDTNLATIPAGYFGGNANRSRSARQVEALAQMRLVVIEKWEGPCWSECIANSSSANGHVPVPCQPSCGQEDYELATIRAVKQINPNVSGVFCKDRSAHGTLVVPAYPS